MFARSTDGGRTFSAPVELSDTMSSAAIPAVASDGTLRIVYLESGRRSCPQSFPTEVTVLTSRDGGRTLARDAVTDVCFALPGTPTGGLYDAYLTWSSDDGRSWSEPMKLSSVPSNGNVRSFADAWSIGHYLGLAVGRDEVAHPVWPDIRPGEASMVNIWTRPVPLRRAGAASG